MRIIPFTVLIASLAFADARGTAPVLRVLKGGQSAPSLVRNGGFEEGQGNGAAPWAAYQQGFRVATGEGRQGSRAAVCEVRSGPGGAGASQTLVLNRTNAAPLVVRGWSKAQNVNGSPDNNYSIYVDLVYADGTSLWGRTGNFRCGTHDWERREFVILPEKPVKSMTVYGLFRGHTGKVWFDDVSVEEIAARDGAVLFQGAPMRVSAVGASAIGDRRSAVPETRWETRDGLRLTLHDNAITSLRVDGRELAAKAPSGFLARDVAANSDVHPFERGACPELGLKVKAEFKNAGNHILVQGRVSDTTGKDRAITLLFALPLDATGWRWGDDIRHDRVVQGNGEFTTAVAVRAGATGTQSLYPLAAVSDDRTGMALGIDMAQPALYRLAYHAGTKQLLVACDFGLVKESQRFPSSADFRFVIYGFDARWGFRAAFEKYTGIFPDHFTVRSKDQGMWMPFTDVSKVQGWEDFGFRYHEGNNNVPWDDEHGILSFRYTEPMTWWMTMKKELPRTQAEALRVRDELARGKNVSQQRLALISQAAAMSDSDGEPHMLFRDTPWCNGAVWSLNPNPWLGVPGSGGAVVLPGGNRQSPTANNQTPSAHVTNAATVHWSEAIKETLYGPKAKGRLDGEYLDSLEGYVTAELNFRREHFRYTTVPLSFDTESKQPALFKGLAVFEFTKWISDDVRRMGKLMFANGVPYRFTYLAPWLDVLGTETDWLRAGKYQPASETTMNLWRTMSGGKPYLLLMNTDYDAFTPDLVEKYFQRCLFYGMFPGMFSHNASENPYWQNPKWYNRDRPLFKKYQPLIKRVAEAGWQPVTEARCDNEKIFVERFGPATSGAVFFTLFNDSNQPQSGTVRANPAALGLGASVQARELLSGQALGPAAAGWKVTLPSQTAQVIHLQKQAR